MRFTKIPLIATLMAVALSLLIVLPGLAQTTDITDGKQSAGVVTAGVFANIADAELGKLTAMAPANVQLDVFVLDMTIYSPIHPQQGSGAHGGRSGDQLPTLVPPNRRSSPPSDTLFRNTLYVSNNGDAYNTILINVASEDPTCNDVDNTKANVTATVKNNRSGRSFTLQLVQSTTEGRNVAGVHQGR